MAAATTYQTSLESAVDVCVATSTELPSEYSTTADYRTHEDAPPIAVGMKALLIHEASLDGATHSRSLDKVAMIELHEWLTRRRYGLFGTLRFCDQQDALQETFLLTIEFAEKMRDLRALHRACFTIGLRVRARRISEYVHERRVAVVDPSVSWNPENHLFEKNRRKRVLMAIHKLHGPDREILQRFYFEEQTQEQIRREMQLTETQFRLRKSRAIDRAGVHAQAERELRGLRGTNRGIPLR